MNDRAALVTGAAGGIGKAIATRLADDGYRVLAGDLVAGDPSQDMVVAHELDVTSIASVTAAVEAAAALGDLQAVVNCAGTLRETRISTADEADIDLMLSVNLVAVMRVCKACLPYLSEGASIVNIGSISSEAGSAPGVSAYAASKGGLKAYGQALACELGRRGIRVNTLAPGIVRAPMADIMLSPDGAEDRLVKNIPLRRLAEPVDIARAVSFLVSSDADYVTGVYLPVDGGLLAT